MRGTHVTVVGLLLVALLASAAGCAGQTGEKPGKAAHAASKGTPAAAKGTSGKANTEAPGVPQPGMPGGGPQVPNPRQPDYGQGPYVYEEGKDLASPWHDTVHWLGLIGTLLAFLVFLGGAVIYLGFNVRGKPFGDPTRKVIRAIHMTGGMVAISLGTVHYVGRCVQLGKLFLNPMPPVYAEAGFLLLLISGVLRFWTPKPIRKHWMVFAWLHRLGFIVALYHVTRHTLYQMSKFAGK